MDRLQDYIYHLPPEQIAQRPAEPRDTSRLMVVDRHQGTWSHHSFREFPNFFKKEDLLVANNSRVRRARLLGRRVLPDGSRGGKIEFLMLESQDASGERWKGLYRSTSKTRVGLKFEFLHENNRLCGEIESVDRQSGEIIARFDTDPSKFSGGLLPLPPYIEANSEAYEAAQEQYQTVYSKEVGSAAAPTAGLHFTPRVMEALSADWAELTLHVGIGTFRPVKTERILDHEMHEETGSIPVELSEAWNAARARGGKITAVGTTSLRALESRFRQSGAITPGTFETRLFLYPGQETPIHGADQLLTNFHLPGSSLLMLVSALAGRELILAAYEEAIREGYRFFSYGDAMLIVTGSPE